MSRKEDILFCKIALNNGLIDQKAATKALALCDQKEKESGRRPLIGALFTKHNLMRNQEVQRIYTAVQKRLGTTAGPQLSPARGRGKGRRGKGNSRDSKFDRRSKPTRPIDPKTLWMGIGGMVVFLGIMVVLILLVLRPEAPPEGTGPGDAIPGGGVAAGPSGSGGTGPKTPSGGGAVKPIAGGGMPDHVKMQVDDQVNDALSEKGTMADAYLARLKDTKQKLADKGYATYPPLERAIKELETIVAAEGQETPEPEEGTPEEPAEEPAAEPAEEPVEEPEEPLEIDDLEKLLEGDL